MDIAEMINRYGFPVIAAAGMGYFIYFVWKWVTTEIKPVIGQANSTLIALIDRILFSPFGAYERLNAALFLGCLLTLQTKKLKNDN